MDLSTRNWDKLAKFPLAIEEQTLLWKKGARAAIICALVRLCTFVHKSGSSVYVKKWGSGYKTVETAVISGLLANGWIIDAIPKGSVLGHFISGLQRWH